jgi:hypothetical protein
MSKNSQTIAADGLLAMPAEWLGQKSAIVQEAATLLVESEVLSVDQIADMDDAAIQSAAARLVAFNLKSTIGQALGGHAAGMVALDLFADQVNGALKGVRQSTKVKSQQDVTMTTKAIEVAAQTGTDFIDTVREEYVKLAGAVIAAKGLVGNSINLNADGVTYNGHSLIRLGLGAVKETKAMVRRTAGKALASVPVKPDDKSISDFVLGR